MKLIAVILTLSVLIMLSLSFKTVDDPKKPARVVKRDTLYRFKKPAAGTTRKPKPAPVIAEEDRNISIDADITRFVVKKSAQKMYVYFGDTFKVFRISLGSNPAGPKERKGDNRTPEGNYKICLKNPNSRGYKSLKISYPDDHDLQNARRQGYDPGGDICIHGLWWPTQDPKTHWKDNWTQGCIAVNNEQIDEIYNHTNLETEISILP